MVNEEKSVVDCLFDEENNDDIILMNENGEKIVFHQIAVIPLKDKTYAILQPSQKIDGVGEDEGLVFSIETNEDGVEYLALCTDSQKIDEVFVVYDELYDEENQEDEE